MLIKWAAGAAVVIAAGIQFVRPDRTNPVTDPARSLLAQPGISREAAAVLGRACRDCHSNDTKWPWYSNVAPVSWWVIDHVNHGRSHFNYSEWTKYGPADARKLLGVSCEATRERGMPLPSYLRMHSAARLSDADVTAICSLIAVESLIPNP
jgi:hypothetical protein